MAINCNLVTIFVKKAGILFMMKNGGVSVVSL
jgi:hypothetical protein